MSHWGILLKLLPQSLNGVSIAKANQFLPTSPWDGVALHCCSNCIVYNVPFGFFLLLPFTMCVFAWQSSNQIALFCFFYHIQTYCSWLAPLLLQLPSLGEEKYTAVSAKHCQTLQGCNVYPLSFFFGTKHWWLEVWQNSFIHLFFFWSFCSCEILPCSSETDQACGNWTRQCRWRDFPSIGHYATTMPWWQSQTMKSEIWCSTNGFLPFKCGI